MCTASKVWPNGMPEVGSRAQRSRSVSSHDIELFTEMSGDRNPLHYNEEVTGEVQITKVRADKPITELETRVVLADGTAVPPIICASFTSTESSLVSLSISTAIAQF